MNEAEHQDRLDEAVAAEIRRLTGAEADDFTERVLARVAQQRRQPASMLPALAAAALLVLAVGVIAVLGGRAGAPPRSAAPAAIVQPVPVDPPAEVAAPSEARGETTAPLRRAGVTASGPTAAVRRRFPAIPARTSVEAAAVFDEPTFVEVAPLEPIAAITIPDMQVPSLANQPLDVQPLNVEPIRITSIASGPF